MDITTDRTLAEVVNVSAGSARVLESFGLDYHVHKENDVLFPAVVVLEQRGTDPAR